jgi:hypothetical protein
MSVLRTDQIKQHGYDFEQLDENIVMVKNFLSKDDLDNLWSIINNSTEDDWEMQQHYTKHLEDRAEQLTGSRDYKAAGIEVTQNWDDKVTPLSGKTPLVQELPERISKFFANDCGFEFRSFGTMQRMYDGTELKAHYDERADKRHVWAAVAYINEDYNGGELFFTHKGIELKPPTGSVMIFPATKEYEHGVKHVLDGPFRYVLPSFIFDHSREAGPSE